MTGELSERLAQEGHLPRVRVRGEEHELVDARFLERRGVLLHGVGVLGRAAGDLLRAVAQPGVVVAQVLVGGPRRVGPEREVSERHSPRLALPAGLLPGGVELGHDLPEPFGGAAAHHPTRAMLCGAAKRGVRLAAQHHDRAAGARRLRPHLVAVPQAAQFVQLAVEDRPAGVEVEPAHLVVVLTAARGDAEHEPASGETIHGRGLLGEQGGVGAERRYQDRREQPDPLGHRGGGRQGDQRLVVVVDDAVGRPERGESGLLGLTCEVDERGALHAPDGVRQSDPDLHMPVSHIDQLPGWARELTETAPLGHLGFLDDRRLPRVLPVTFAAAGEAFWSAVDHKPKRVPGRELARVRWLRRNPAAALTVDRYSDDWERLAWVQALGQVEVLDEPAPAALEALTAKYAPDRERAPAGPFLRAVPARIP